MDVGSYQLADGCSLALDASGRKFLKIAGHGRGCVLKVEGPVAGVWIPLRGALQITSGDVKLTLQPGELRVTEMDQRISAVGHGDASWVALLGDSQTWRQLLQVGRETHVPDPLLLPAHHAVSRTLRVDAAILAKESAGCALETAVTVLGDHLVALQAELERIVARCPGRTYAQRRQVFVRLQRVRNYLIANRHLELDNGTLARMASYSPWQFIRAFRTAYGQTPHAVLVDLRLERALDLLRNSPLAIAEIARASGFEDRCAFSRLFRRRFGDTASSVREQFRNAIAWTDRAIAATPAGHDRQHEALTIS